jgi:SAM-dependent methyltransferase
MPAELEKWDRIYAAHSSNEMDPHIESFNTELLGAVQAILPAGSAICEMGCGAGWQSVALARSGRYLISCLDFSDVALNAARQVFAHNGQRAEFRNENGLLPGRPEFDLVFNAGVLEHYTFEQQVSFLKGMASRSRRYVLAIVPNSSCYWYWVWRLRTCAKGAWPYGKEVPRCDLKDVFTAAGLQFAGVQYYARDWAELFVEQTIDDPAVREAVLRVHRAAPVGTETRSYLVAALGVLPGEDASWLADVGWRQTAGELDFTREQLATALVDSVSEGLFFQSQLAELTRRLEGSAQQKALEAGLTELHAEAKAQRTLLADWNAALEAERQERAAAEERAGRTAAELEEERATRRRSEELLEAALAREQKLAAEREEQARHFQEVLAPLESQVAAQNAALEAERQERAAAEERAGRTAAELEEERVWHRCSEELLRAAEAREQKLVAEREAHVRLLAAERKALGAAEDRIKQFMEALAQKNAQIVAQNALAADLASSLEEKQVAHLAVVRTAAELEAECASLRQSGEVLRAMIARGRGENEHLQHQLQECEMEKAALKESLEDRLQRTQTRLNHCLHELDNVRQHRETLARNLEQACRDIYAGNEELAKARQRIELLEADHAPGLTRGALHGVLTGMQRITPEFMRAAVRKPYLNYFYYRVYPEKRPVPSLPPLAPIPAPQASGILAHSGYEPFLSFKSKLCGPLSQDFRTLSSQIHDGRVSVVLPVYNGEDYIRESVESVLAQTYPDFELIVVDDGSTDGTSGILASYAADPRVRVMRQANQKLPAALSNGFAQATGEFYTWTSADNIMAPDQLAEMVRFLREHLAVEMVYADEEIIGEDGRALENSDFCPGYQTPPGSNVICWPSDPGELNFVQNNYIGGCFLYRAWAAKIVGEYVRDTFGFEDYDYWMRMNALFRVAHFGRRRPLYRYRLHSASLTARDGELRITERVREFMHHEEERRQWFLQPIDVVLAGNHGWAGALASIYENAGHNVFRLEDLSPDTLYRLKVTRAHSKSLAILAGAAGPSRVGEELVAIRTEQKVHTVLLLDGASSNGWSDELLVGFDWLIATDAAAWLRIAPSFARRALHAAGPAFAAYPLVALTNRLSWESRPALLMSRTATTS